MKKQTISAVIAVKNEEKNIKRCLESIKWVDEMIIIDSSSTDATLEIAEGYSPKIHQFVKDDYLLREKLNFGINKATKDWVLIVDADEEITPELRIEIIKKIENTPYDAFNVHFQNYSFGRFLKGSFWKDMPVTRLFRRGKAIYKEIEPHKLISVDGKMGELNGYINHYVYANTGEFLAKTDRYTTVSAKYIIKNKKGGILNRPLKDINFYSCYIEPVLFSGWIFFRKKMYKDHIIGLWLSLLMGYYLYLERKKVKNLMDKK